MAITIRPLDERSRELIRLKFHEDLSYKEIAARTGLKPGHVGYLLHHALKVIQFGVCEPRWAPFLTNSDRHRPPAQYRRAH